MTDKTHACYADAIDLSCMKCEVSRYIGVGDEFYEENGEHIILECPYCSSKHTFEKTYSFPQHRGEATKISLRLLTKKYNHAYDIGFSVRSFNKADKVTEKEIIKGLEVRIEELKYLYDKNDGQIHEAVGLPSDTYEEDA